MKWDFSCKNTINCYSADSATPVVSTAGRGAPSGAPAFLRDFSLRTFVYVDGFNLYYRALKNTHYKWLDLKSLFQTVLQKQHKIEKIKYFTARVRSHPSDPSKAQRQDVYLRALSHYTPEINAHFGHFLSHVVRSPLAHPTGSQRTVEIIKTEEKGSDVNFAVHLLNDAWLDRYDCAIVVSNDSDLAESIRLVKIHHKKSIGLITPGKGRPSRELLNNVDFSRRLRSGALQKNQLPNPIPGTNIHKPPTW